MEANYYAPYDSMVAEDPPLQPVRPYLDPLGDPTWEPLTFEEHQYSGSGLFLKADSSLQILYSYPELDLSNQSGIRHTFDENAYGQGVSLAKSDQPMSG